MDQWDPDQRIAGIAATQHGVFSRRQAAECGFSRHAIEHRLKVGSWIRFHPGVYGLRGVPATFEQSLMAAVLAAGEDAIASHLSAAALFALVPDRAPLQISVPAGANPRVSGVKVFRSRDLAVLDRCLVDGVPATRLPRLFLDLATILEPSRLEWLLDEALAARRLTLAHLEMRVDACRGGRDGLRVLGGLIAERRGERYALNGFERRIVRLLTSHGLAPTATQYVLVMPSGRRLRLDAAFPERRFGIEGQSYRWHSSKGAWRNDQTRLAELNAIGWHVLPITPEDIDERPLWIIGQVALGLAAVR